MTDIGMKVIAQLVTAAVAGPVAPRIPAAVIGHADPFHGGSHRIINQVIYSGQPAHRRVKLFRREGGGYQFIRECWSDPVTGTYVFDYIAPGVYLALADDYLGQKTAVAADPIQSVPMP